jgi:chaperonin cofactor prefoldin
MRTDEEEPGLTKRTEVSNVGHKLVAEDLVTAKKEKAGDNLNFDINELQKRIMGLESKMNEDSDRMQISTHHSVPQLGL